MRRSDKPYLLRQCKGRAISAEFRFNPGKRISTGCYDMPSAVLWAEDYLRNMGQTSANAQLFKDYTKDFYLRTDPSSFRAHEKAFGKEYSDAYCRKQQARLENHILPYFGTFVCSMITSQMIEQWLVSFRPLKGKSLSNNARNKCLLALRQIFDDMKRKGLRQDNPARDVRLMTERCKPREALPDEAIAVLFPADPEERINVWGSLMWAVYFSISYDTGMRPGEIAALRVCDIRQSINGGLSVTTRRAVSVEQKRIVERVKTSGKGYSKRGGLLYHDTADLLIRYIKEKGLHGEDLLFKALKRTDGLLMPETSNKHLKKTLNRYGFYKKGRVQYCLRHNYETDRRGDLSDEALAVSMGHTKLRDDYDHQDEEDLARRLESVRGELFRNRERRMKGRDIVPLEDILDKDAR